MKLKRLPSVDRLRDVLSYNEETGQFVWKKRISIRIMPGKNAASMSSDGYYRIGIDGARIKAHRLAWLYVYGEDPPAMIDHIDGNKTNNAISNLRAADNKINGQNQRRANIDSKTGTLGVTKRSENAFVSHIGKDGKNYYIGSFRSAEAAHSAYVEAKRKLHKGGTL